MNTASPPRARWHSASARLVLPAAIAMGGGLAGAGIWFADPTTPGGPIPVCPTKLLFGIDCPGCGSMRMLYSLMHADLAGALRFNALGLATTVLLLVSFGTWTYGRWSGRQVRNWQHHPWSAPVALGVVVVWFVVRNIPVAPFVFLRV